MGVLNVTPDSFSDGGLWLDPAAATDHALQMLNEGADLIDIGAESTRPGGGVYGEGADFVPAQEEWRRLEPVLTRLREETDVPLSVDTRKAEVARRALQCGADLINDVAALADEAMAEVVSEAGCPVILMHSRGEIRTMQREIHFRDVTGEVREELSRAMQQALESGIEPEQVLLDPGIGFGKTAEQNLQLLRRLDLLAGLGRPIVLGASRKSFIASASPAPADRRLGGSLAAAAWAARGGCAILRVHDVEQTAQFLRLSDAIAEAT